MGGGGQITITTHVDIRGVDRSPRVCLLLSHVSESTVTMKLPDRHLEIEVHGRNGGFPQEGMELVSESLPLASLRLSMHYVTDCLSKMMNIYSFGGWWLEQRLGGVLYFTARQAVLFGFGITVTNRCHFGVACIRP